MRPTDYEKIEQQKFFKNCNCKFNKRLLKIINFAEEFNNEELFNFIHKLPCKWALSYDGISGKENNTFAVPEHIYKIHKYLDASYSSFKKIVKKEEAKVSDSIYLNYIL